MYFKVLAMAVAVGLGLTSFDAVAATHTASDQAAQLAQRDREIAELKQELADIQARIGEIEQRTDAQSDINVNTQQSVEALQTSSAKADDTAKQANSNTINGKVFFNISDLSQESHGTDTAASGVGIDVKRFYFSVTHQFNDAWSANLTTDFNYVSNDGETNLFVKKAYLQRKFSDAAVLRLGSADMPWIPFVENYYGFRYVENTITDKLKVANSADWGVHLGGQVNGNFNYAVSAVNGAGYKNPTRSKRMDVEGRIGFVPFQNAVIAVGAYSGTLGKETQTVDAQHTAKRFDILAAYSHNSTRFGVEYFQANNWNNVLTALSDKEDGYSLWGSVGLGESTTLFARYDRAKTSKDLNPSLKDTYFNLGLEFPVYKGVKFSAVYKHDRLEDQGPTDLKTDELGVWGEVAF